MRGLESALACYMSCLMGVVTRGSGHNSNKQIEVTSEQQGRIHTVSSRAGGVFKYGAGRYQLSACRTPGLGARNCLKPLLGRGREFHPERLRSPSENLADDATVGAS